VPERNYSFNWTAWPSREQPLGKRSKTMNTKLLRSRTDTVIAGVCGGLARYLNIDVTLVRVFFVAVVLAGGAGVLAYIILWLIMPLEGVGTEMPAGQTLHSPDNSSQLGPGPGALRGQDATQGGLIIGGVLIVLGGLFLMQNLVGPWFPWISFGTLWPLLLVAGGIVLLMRGAKGATR
jgi:phage shock protein PspC (stress-responsive transcriptional regulator)